MTWSAARTVRRSRKRRARYSAREPSGKAAFVCLGAQVVVVEDKAGPVQAAEEQADRPEDIGRVAALDGGETLGRAPL